MGRRKKRKMTEQPARDVVYGTTTTWPLHEFGRLAVLVVDRSGKAQRPDALARVHDALETLIDTFSATGPVERSRSGAGTIAA
jgi:hypothetical protein